MSYSEIIEKIKKTTSSYSMFDQGETIMVAVSGGPDSVVLLRMLHVLGHELGVSLVVAHLNHSLRPNADDDAEFVSLLSSELGLECIIRKVDVAELAKQNGYSIEEAARKARYAFFAEEAAKRGIKKVASGHTSDDQAETILMRIIRGTGLRGLCAIRPKIIIEGLEVVRPIIDVSRDEIWECVRQKQYPFLLDESNRSLEFDRNKVRHLLMPLLEMRFNEKVRDAVSKLAYSASVDMDYINGKADSAFDRLLLERADGHVVLAVTELRSLHASVAYRVCEKAIECTKADAACDFDHWQDLWNLLSSKKCGAIEVAGGVRISVQQKDCVFSVSQPEEISFSYSLASPDSEILIPEAGIKVVSQVVNKEDIFFKKNSTKQFFDAEKICFPVNIRSRVPGDVIKPLGMKDSHRKVQDVLVDLKISRYKRSAVPLFETSQGIMWVAPFIVSEDYKITDETSQIIAIEIQDIA